MLYGRGAPVQSWCAQLKELQSNISTMGAVNTCPCTMYKMYMIGQILLVLTLDGNSEIGEPVRSNLCSLICERQLDREQSQIGFFSPKRRISLHACAICSE